MWSKIIFLFATLYVVNASVMSINVYEGDGSLQSEPNSDLEDSFSLRSCNNQECDQRCRRLKFTGGVCVNGRCKCDNFRSAEFAAIMDDYLALHSCNFQECDQRCRRLKFPGGACVNGRCKCDLFQNAEGGLQSEPNPDLEDSFSLRSCNNQECDQRCRRLKFTGGVCVNGRCKCDNFRSAEFAALMDDYLALRSCNFQECDQRCRRLKFHGGVCVNGRCKCDLFRNAEDFDSSEEFGLHRCNYRKCNERCQILGYSGGVCVNGHCFCKSVVFRKDLEGLEDVLPLNSCYYRECTQRCRSLGYRYGNCVNGRCRCNGRNMEKTSTQKPSVTVPTPVDNTLNNEIGDTNFLLNEDDRQSADESSY